VDAGNYRVQYFSPAGSFLGRWGARGSGQGRFDDPQGIAVGENGNVYVADAGNHRVQRFTSGGSYVRSWGTRGSGDGQFNTPCGVAVGPEGNIYVVDCYNHRIQYFSPTGSFLGKWGSIGTGDGQLNYAWGVAATRWSRSDTSTVRVYVADTNNNRVQYFKDVRPVVEPTSLGRVKGLFK
jgi:DNA-binding beta-propeller fold protein YncE